MKKGSRIILIVLLILTLFINIGHSETQPHSFTPKIINTLNKSVVEWLYNENNRAVLSVLLFAEAGLDSKTVETFTSGLAYDSIVAKADSDVVILACASSNKILTIMYSTTGKVGSWDVIENSGPLDDFCNFLTLSGLPCFSNTAKAIFNATDSIANILGGGQ